MADGLEGVNNLINVNGKLVDVNTMSIQQVMLILMNERVESLTEKTGNELKELVERQKLVAELHNVLAGINSATDKDGKISVAKGSELESLLKRAEELGVKIPKTEGTFERDERERLVENLRMTVEDLNVKNDMQLQKVTKYTNERYEAYQMARSIMKAPDDAVKSSARNIAGR